MTRTATADPRNRLVALVLAIVMAIMLLLGAFASARSVASAHGSARVEAAWGCKNCG